MKKIYIYFSDEIKPFCRRKLSKKDKALFKARASKPEFLLSRSLLARAGKRGRVCVSHKKFGGGALAAVGISNLKFGLDLETLKERDFSAVVDFCFNDYEKSLFSVCESAQKTLLFYQIYTLKEAIIKARNLDFAALGKVGLSESGARDERGRLMRFKTYLLYDKFVISVCFKGRGEKGFQI